MENKRKEIKDLVSCLYHEHDLSIKAFDESIEKITDIIFEDVKKHPSIKANRYTVIQILLENF